MKKIVVFLLFLATAFCLFADEDEKSKLAVMEFEDLSGKLSKNILSRATERIRSKFVASNKFIVIAKERQEKAMIKEMKKESYKACNDKNCQIPLGQALSADTILRTTINFFGDTYTITSELIDLEKEATVKGAEANFDGSEKSLNAALNDIVAQIIGRKAQSSNFQTGRFGGKTDDWDVGGGEETIVKFESSPTGAVVLADGKLLCQSTPCSKMLTTGNHEIEMQMENYVPNSQKQNIKEGKTVKFTLEPDFAWLSVSGNYAVSVKLDGSNIGQIPIKDKAISTGNHKIEHTDSCFYDLGETFTVKRGEKKNIRFDLDPRESAVKVYAQDEKGNDLSADVFVDDKKVGKAPGTFKVPLCSKKLVVKNSSDEYSKELSLKERNVQTVQATLKSKAQKNNAKSGNMANLGNLQWSNKAPHIMNGYNAVKYCENLNEGGHNDWRLPNIDELRTLIQNCPQTETGMQCKVSEKNGCLSSSCGKPRGSCYCQNTGNGIIRNIHTIGYFSKLGDDVALWSSSTNSDYKGSAWFVNFAKALVGSYFKTSLYDVRCVR